jgi:hypothetical protein
MKKSNLQRNALIIMMIISFFFIYFAYISKGNNFWLTITGGVATGALIAMAQYLVSLREQREIDQAYKELYKKEKEIEEFKKMGVERILTTRDDPETYGSIISESTDRIWVMGNTASRMLDDFANKDASSKWYSKALLGFLDKGGEVKILISDQRYLFRAKDRKKFDLAKMQLNELSKKYSNFNYCYTKHIPTHSIFVFDEYCLLGPIFDNIESKATPALAMDTNSEYAQKYLSYFNNQWVKYYK